MWVLGSSARRCAAAAAPAEQLTVNQAQEDSRVMLMSIAMPTSTTCSQGGGRGGGRVRPAGRRGGACRAARRPARAEHLWEASRRAAPPHWRLQAGVRCLQVPALGSGPHLSGKHEPLGLDVHLVAEQQATRPQGQGDRAPHADAAIECVPQQERLLACGRRQRACLSTCAVTPAASFVRVGRGATQLRPTAPCCAAGDHQQDLWGCGVQSLAQPAVCRSPIDQIATWHRVDQPVLHASIHNNGRGYVACLRAGRCNRQLHAGRATATAAFSNTGCQREHAEPPSDDGQARLVVWGPPCAGAPAGARLQRSDGRSIWPRACGLPPGVQLQPVRRGKAAPLRCSQVQQGGLALPQHSSAPPGCRQQWQRAPAVLSSTPLLQAPPWRRLPPMPPAHALIAPARSRQAWSRGACSAMPPSWWRRAPPGGSWWRPGMTLPTSTSCTAAR